MLARLLSKLRKPTVSQAASTLGKRGAQVRKERERERFLSFHRDMRARLGLPECEAFK